MKALVLIGLFLTQSVFALPYVCESDELDNGQAVLRFKVNDKVQRQMMGSVWSLYLVGAVPAQGQKQIVYGSGTADKSKIAMTFVKDSFVLGSVQAHPHKDGLFYGEANLSGVAKNKTLSVICRDEAKK